MRRVKQRHTSPRAHLKGSPLTTRTERKKRGDGEGGEGGEREKQTSPHGHIFGSHS